jgi:hypothetical protein
MAGQRTHESRSALCADRDSNSDGLPHGILSPARLPVPPSAPGSDRAVTSGGAEVYQGTQRPPGGIGRKMSSRPGVFPQRGTSLPK